MASNLVIKGYIYITFSRVRRSSIIFYRTIDLNGHVGPWRAAVCVSAKILLLGYIGTDPGSERDRNGPERVLQGVDHACRRGAAGATSAVQLGRGSQSGVARAVQLGRGSQSGATGPGPAGVPLGPRNPACYVFLL